MVYLTKIQVSLRFSIGLKRLISACVINVCYISLHSCNSKGRIKSLVKYKARFRRRSLHVPNLIVLDATLERDKNGSDSNGAPNTMLLTGFVSER